MNWRPTFLRSVWLWLCASLVTCSLTQSTAASVASPLNTAERGVRVYLNPNTGRFWTMDSYVGNNYNSLSLHKYHYCHSNPVNGSDPSGRDEIFDFQLGQLYQQSLIHRYEQWWIGAFTFGPLGKKLASHYVGLSGETYPLSIDDMVEIGARFRRDESEPSVAKGIGFQQYQQQLSSGPIQIVDMRLLLVATEGMTLGDFTAYLSGTLSGAPDDWTFQGTMRYADTYNFEYHEGRFLNWFTPREMYCFSVRNSIKGKGFPVTSAFAPVKQSSKESEIQWKGTGVVHPPTLP